MTQIKLNLLGRGVQLSDKNDVTSLSIGEAVENSIVDSKTLEYFLARIQLFLQELDYNPKKIRFRQHMLLNLHSMLVISFSGNL